jgi:hypothetical protein
MPAFFMHNNSSTATVLRAGNSTFLLRRIIFYLLFGDETKVKIPSEIKQLLKMKNKINISSAICSISKDIMEIFWKLHCHHLTTLDPNFQGAKYLGFFSARSLKTREKYISFAQFIFFFVLLGLK